MSDPASRFASLDSPPPPLEKHILYPALLEACCRGQLAGMPLRSVGVNVVNDWLPRMAPFNSVTTAELTPLCVYPEQDQFLEQMLEQYQLMQEELDSSWRCFGQSAEQFTTDLKEQQLRWRREQERPTSTASAAASEEEGEKEEKDDAAAASVTGPPSERKKRRGNLPKPATRLLQEWLSKNLQHPYPTEQQKLQFANQTGLTTKQIDNWFINTRRRQMIKRAHFKHQQQQQQQQQDWFVNPRRRHIKPAQLKQQQQQEHDETCESDGETVAVVDVGSSDEDWSLPGHDPSDLDVPIHRA